MSKENMKTLMLINTTSMISTKSPLPLAMKIMLMSILSATVMYSTQKFQWLSLLVIITFSTAMMILFIYTASALPNEKSKSSIKLIAPIILLSLITWPTEKSNMITTPQAKKFSSSMIPLLPIMILMVAMMSMTFMASNPQTTINSSF